MPGVSLWLTVAAVLGGVTQPPATGSDVIRMMHARYQGKWYRTLSFVQRAIYPDGRPEEEWWEAALIPGRLRIDVAPVDSGRTIMYRADSNFAFERGKLVRAVAGQNILAILGFDVYGQPPERTIELVGAEAFDLAKLREAEWAGKAAYVIGGDGRELWIEKDRLLFLKVIQPGPGNTSTDISFNKYVKLGGGWIGTEVLFLRNGKEFFREVYRDWKINPAITDDLFQTSPWRRAAWIPKP
jgi:hypothetical protein